MPATLRITVMIKVWSGAYLLWATHSSWVLRETTLTLVPAYVFTRTGSSWTQQTKLTASDAATGDFFGSTVSFSAETVVIGAYGNDDAGSQSGSVYVYTRSGSTWTQQVKLVASDASSNGWFGISASLSGNTALIGASRSDGNSGSVYVFTRSGSTWTSRHS